jgi:methionyl-tRNA formyltransferase
MSKLKIIFIGGLTNGKIVWDYLNRNTHVDLLLTITYPNATDKPRHIDFPDGEKIVKNLSANSYLNEIESIQPDYIFVTGWSELLNDKLLLAAKSGVLGFHPSKLPYDRGRSVLAWQIEDGYSLTALTLFFYNSIPDGGDIVAQEIINIESYDYINDILDKIDSATYNIMNAYFPLLRQGLNPRKKQDLNEGNFRRLRSNLDSIIDWHQSNQIILNKIRAISLPYPGATSLIKSQKHIIYKAECLDEFLFCEQYEIGSKVSIFQDGTFIVKCGVGYLKINEYSLD